MPASSGTGLEADWRGRATEAGSKLSVIEQLAVYYQTVVGLPVRNCFTAWAAATDGRECFLDTS